MLELNRNIKYMLQYKIIFYFLYNYIKNKLKKRLAIVIYTNKFQSK